MAAFTMIRQNSAEPETSVDAPLPGRMRIVVWWGGRPGCQSSKRSEPLVQVRSGSLRPGL